VQILKIVQASAQTLLAAPHSGSSMSSFFPTLHPTSKMSSGAAYSEVNAALSQLV
jgi:hypothetical protein